MIARGLAIADKKIIYRGLFFLQAARHIPPVKRISCKNILPEVFLENYCRDIGSADPSVNSVYCGLWRIAEN
jgi:hypothetical protein